MNLRFRFLWPTVILSSVLSAGTVFAHGDADKPLFVAASGSDTGLCLDPAAPCKTIGYALDYVGKGGQIRVAAGTYTLADTEDVFHLVSNSVDVRGGYQTGDNFSRQAIGNSTTLIGIPHEHGVRMRQRGFNVLADLKGIEQQIAEKTANLLTLQANMKSSLPAAQCSNGMVNGLVCEKVDLFAHVSFGDVSAVPSAAADVWGFTDLNTNREYAIVGYNTGTGVFDVTDPENPREVGFVDGQTTSWRDIKVYQYWNASDNRWNAAAYISADGASDTLFVIDLSELPHHIRRINYSGEFSAAHNIFLTNTDVGTGLSVTGSTPSLIVAGSNYAEDPGPYRSYTLDNPHAPLFAAMPGTGRSDYMHDSASMIITDIRKDTQCVNATSYCEVLFDFNELDFNIWDVTDTANPVRLTNTSYANAAYTHSGWPTEDGQYLFVHDELDERNLGLNTTVRVFSLSDLTAPVEVGAWTGPTNAIDHNGYVRGNRYYMSGYSRGLTIFDITDAPNLAPVGRLDTYPFSEGVGFPGAWGVFPYFNSGTIAISDIDSGLYLAEDKTLEVIQGSLSFSRATYGAAEGDQLSIPVRRTGGAVGDISVTYSLVPATGDRADVSGGSGILNWADGDSADKLISMDLVADADAESLERMILRLSTPTGGATLSPGNVASVYVGEAAQPAVVQFSHASIDIAERGFATAVVVVERDQSAVGAVSVDYALSAGDADAGIDFRGATSGSISWADGDADSKWIEFPIIDDGTGEATEFYELTLSNAGAASVGARSKIRINIADGTGVNNAPNAVAGAGQTVNSRATVTLNGTQSNDPDGDSIAYQWSQIAGPAVTLGNSNTATASFTAPSVTSDTLLRFDLTVSDSGGLSNTSATSVTVNRTGGSTPNKSGGGSTGFLLLACFAVIGLVRQRSTRKDAAE